MSSIKTQVLQHGRPQVYKQQVTGQSRFLPYIFVALSAIAVLIVGIILPLQANYQALPTTPFGPWLLSLTHLLFPNEPHTLVQHVPAPRPYIPLISMWRMTGLLFVAIIVLFACYLLAMKYLPGSVSRRFILLSTALLGLIYLLIPTFTSQDIFSYIIYARMGLLYHLNPLTTLPTASRHDLVYPYIFWIHQPSAYGPMWALITCLLQWATSVIALVFRSSDLLSMVLLLRLWGLAMHLGSAQLIWSISGRWQRLNGAILERTRLTAVVAFAWHPLLLFEACVNAHIDTTILFFVLFALWALLPRGENARQPYLLAAFLLALATCLKVTVILLFPGLLLFLWAQHPRRLRPIIVAALLYGVMIALLYAPFWQNGAILDVLHINPGLTRDVNSPYEFFLRLYEGLRGQRLIFVTSDVGSPLEIVTHKISMVLFVIVYGAICLWYLVKPERINTLKSLARWMALAWLLYCLVGSPWFWPWYMTTFFGLAALIMAMTTELKPLFGWLDARKTFFLLSYSMLSTYCVLTWAPTLTPVPLLAYFSMSQLRGLWAWGFLLAALPLWSWRSPSNTLIAKPLFSQRNPMRAVCANKKSASPGQSRIG